MSKWPLTEMVLTGRKDLIGYADNMSYLLSRVPTFVAWGLFPGDVLRHYEREKVGLYGFKP